MKTRTFWGLIGAIALIVIAVEVFADNPPSPGSSPGSTTPPTRTQIALARKSLAVNRNLANQVVDGSIDEQLSDLRGLPIVVNQWASWCPSCREEFPFFQQISKRLRGRVAFLGLDSQDDRGVAEDFLQQYPVEYPSLFDQDASQAASIGGGQGWPTTIFYDRNGELTYLRQGGYTSAAALLDDIKLYALN